LTDAVVTAIAVEEPFTDEFLQGTLPLLPPLLLALLVALGLLAPPQLPTVWLRGPAQR